MPDSSATSNQTQFLQFLTKEIWSLFNKVVHSGTIRSHIIPKVYLKNFYRRGSFYRLDLSGIISDPLGLDNSCFWGSAQYLHTPCLSSDNTDDRLEAIFSRIENEYTKRKCLRKIKQITQHSIQVTLTTSEFFWLFLFVITTLIRIQLRTFNPYQSYPVSALSSELAIISDWGLFSQLAQEFEPIFGFSPDEPVSKLFEKHNLAHNLSSICFETTTPRDLFKMVVTNEPIMQDIHAISTHQNSIIAFSLISTSFLILDSAIASIDYYPNGDVFFSNQVIIEDKSTNSFSFPLTPHLVLRFQGGEPPGLFGSSVNLRVNIKEDFFQDYKFLITQPMPKLKPVSSIIPDAKCLSKLASNGNANANGSDNANANADVNVAANVPSTEMAETSEIAENLKNPEISEKPEHNSYFSNSQQILLDLKEFLDSDEYLVTVNSNSSQI